MYQRKAIFACIFLICVLIFSVTSMAQSTVQPRVTQAVDGRMVQLKGNIHPLAQPQFDRGLAPDSLPADRMLLVLQRGPDQEAELQQLLEDQQTKSTPRYHQWLTPQEFGLRFGPADADIAAVTNWLTSQGFRVNRVGAGRTAIEFSGTAGQVRQAFHTEIHKFVVNGEEHWANATDPQIPAALAPVVRGVVSLNNFLKKPMHRSVGKPIPLKETGGATPLFTTTAGCGANGTQPCYAVGPGDFATIYNVLPLWNGGVDGTGQSIAIVARSNINLQDVADFRSIFGLPANPPNIVLDGPDPGLVPGDESEAVLDAEWAGGIAKGATVYLVVSEFTEVIDGVDLSAFYIVDNNLAGVVSVSFGGCEAAFGQGENAFWQFLWEEATAQGMTPVVAAGDDGSAACDDFNTETASVDGLAISGLASTPFNVAVGGTDFDDVENFSVYWNSGSDPTTKTSAKSYIPELTWNDSCAQQGVSGGCLSPAASLQNIVAGSGGPSTCGNFNSPTCQGTAKPAWQGGTGVPADGVRDIPDVSLFAGDGENSSFYILCEADLFDVRCIPGGGFLSIGGTSASVQAFAGIMALVNHKVATQATPAPRQGNANFVLYPLAAKQGASCNSSSGTANPASCIFYDITKGNNSVPCAGGTGCNNTSAGFILTDPKNPTNPGWTTTAGYDLATGLGSVNVNNLATNWSSVSFTPTATTLALSPLPVNTTHGQSVNVNITVAPTSGSGTPTGAVSLIGGPNNTNLGIDAFALTNGAVVNGSEVLLPGGSYTVTAHYGGDGTFGASDSTPPIQVTVGKEASRTFLHLVTADVSGNAIYTATTTPYGSLYLVRADVTNATDGFQPAPFCSTGCPTGTVTINDNSQPLGPGTFKLNSAGFTEDQPAVFSPGLQQPIQLTAGAHNLTGQYSGDNSFNTSAATALAISISKASTGLAAISPSTQSVAAGTNFTLTTTVQTLSLQCPTCGLGAAPTGTVTFSDGGTALTGSVTTVPVAGSANGPAFLQVTLTTSLSAQGAHQITASYTGDTNYAAAGPTAAVTVTVTAPPTFSASGSAAAGAAGGSTTSTITLTPSAAFNGQVAVSCPAASSPPGVTCDPLNITVNGSAQVSGQLTVHIAAPSTPGTTAEVQPATRIEYAGLQGPPFSRSGWWKLSAGSGLAAIFLFIVPGRRRYRATLGLWLICVLSFAMGCGGGSSGTGTTGPVTTITRITAPVTKAAQGTSLSFNVTVAGGTPAGTVQLFDGTTAIGSATQVSSGAATISTSALSVGTHQISAHYSGDANTLASQSGAVSVTLTGTTSVGIATNPASSNNATFALTIN